MEKLGNVQVRIKSPSGEGQAWAVTVAGYREGLPRIRRGFAPTFFEAYWLAIAAYLDTDVDGAKTELNFPE